MMRTTARTVRSALALSAMLLCLAPALGAQDTGSADFTRYVSIGDSLTAGFMSGGLVETVQNTSYPKLIYTQARGTSEGFEQPTVSAPGLPPLLQLRNLSPLVIAPPQGLGNATNLFLPRPYNNLAVPGATVHDLLNTVSDNGGLHDLVLRGLGTQLQLTLAQQPTFVSVWVGNNDVLGAAVSGIVIDGVTLTTAAEFEAKFRAITGAIAATGAQMVLANLPSVTAIPFVTTLPPILVDTGNNPVLVNGAPVPLIGPDGPLVLGRDFLLLTATQQLSQGRGIPVAFGGSGQPLTTDVVLSGSEVATISARITQLNQIIRAVANETGSALVDVNGIFDRIVRNGITFGGINFTTTFLQGGLFSFDGVHSTPLGYAITANEFIKAINAHYGASIPQVGLAPYVFGPLASAGTSFSAAPGALKFIRASENQLRFALGIPDRKTLRDLSTGGGSGGGQGGGGSGGGGGSAGGGGGGGSAEDCPLPRGHGKYCDVCGPCAEGVGDCDLNKPNQCAPGLSCVQDVGADFGFGPKIDVCMAP